MSLDLSRLTNVKVTPTGWEARCPACAANGSDKSGNHLSILRGGQFNCIVGSKTPGHNRIIRSLIVGDGSATDVEYIEPASTLSIEKVFPESALAKLLPDVSYWMGRGMKEGVMHQLENGLAPSGGEKWLLQGRTIFPVRNLAGRLVGFAGRLAYDGSFAKKWLNMVKTSKVVYPWHLTGPAIRASKTAVLVESIGDLCALLSHDIKPVLCIFGLNLNSLVISTLVGADVRRVIISLNRDPDPVKSHSGAAVEGLQRKLAPFFSRVEVRLPESKDWGKAAEGGETGAAELARFRAEVET